MVSPSGSGLSSVVLDVVRRQIEERRAVLDRAQDLGSVTITVRLYAGTTNVKGVIWQEDRVVSQMKGRD